MKKYRWGVLGTGAIARKFTEDLKKISAAVLHSVYSRTYSTAKAFADEHGFKTTHKNLSTFLRDSDLDIVYVATPNHLHCEFAVKCMKAGKHVLIEKPLALNAGEARLIAQVANKNERFCMEAMWSRFIPAYRKVQNLLEQKEIGKIKLITAEFGLSFPYKSEQFRFSPEKGGGSLLDLGVYPISLILMFLGKPDVTYGECRKADSGVDILNRITLNYNNGPIVDIRSSFMCRLSNGVSIVGEKGRLEIPGPIYSPKKFIQSQSSHSSKKTGEVSFLNRISTFIKKRVMSWRQSNTTNVPFHGYGYQFEALEVMKMLEQGKKESSVMPLKDSIAVLEITDQLRENWGVHFPEADNINDKTETIKNHV